MKKNFRSLSMTVILLAVILAMSLYMTNGIDTADKGKREPIDYSQMLSIVKDNGVKALVLQGEDLYGIKTDTKVDVKTMPANYDFKTRIPSVDTLTKDLNSAVAQLLKIEDPSKVTSGDYPFSYTSIEPQRESIFAMILPYIGIMIAFGLLFFFIMRQQGGGNKTFSFGKSRAHLYTDSKRRVTFEQVAGADEEKEELKEVVEFLRSPKKFLEIGARIPKGVLLIGPPGTGKTLLAKAVAGEAGVPFFSISGSDFVELFVGVGASRVRDLFEQAKRNVPCIIFIDEIDAVGRHRGAGMGGGHDEREQTLNQLLVEMDGFSVNEGIIILAATNRPDILDPALLRPGRFDRQVTVNYPDIKGREEIFMVHTKGKPLAEDVNLNELAKLTPWFTGADIENIVNEGAILAARRNKLKIEMIDLREAISRVMMGPEKRSKIVTEKDKKLVAYHEAGHAVVAFYSPHSDPVHEVSIIPRGKAGGYTMTLDKEDVHYVSKAKLIDKLSVLMGGHVAEKMVLGDISTGSTSDLQQASVIARRMITEYGMSDAMGPVYLGTDHEVFLGRDFSKQNAYSEQIAAKIDDELHRLIDEAQKTATRMLTEKSEKLHKLASALLEREKLDASEFKQVMEDEPAYKEEQGKGIDISPIPEVGV